MEKNKQYKLNCRISQHTHHFLLDSAIKLSEQLQIKVTVSDVVNRILRKAFHDSKNNQQEGVNNAS